MDLGLTMVVLICLILAIIVWKLSRKKKLSRLIIIRFSQKIRETASLAPAHSILESHKIFAVGLSHLYKKQKTAAQKIAGVAKRLPNIKRIWGHHGLRNRIAHETDVRVSKTQAASARKDFIKALDALG